MMERQIMRNLFRDCDILFSAKDGGIWLHDNKQARLLRLENCLTNTGKTDNNSKCVGSCDITKLTFTLFSTPQTIITFSKGILPYIRTKKTAVERFHSFKRDIQSLGFTTYDLS